MFRVVRWPPLISVTFSVGTMSVDSFDSRSCVWIRRQRASFTVSSRPAWTRSTNHCFAMMLAPPSFKLRALPEEPAERAPDPAAPREREGDVDEGHPDTQDDHRHDHDDRRAHDLALRRPGDLG